MLCEGDRYETCIPLIGEVLILVLMEDALRVP